MRVVSGSAKGLKLLSLDSLVTRPTLDRVKEALFSILAPYIPGSSVLDLFSGSGALGIEALSRGAKEAVFVDNLPAALDIVKKNASRARVGQSSRFCLSDALNFLKSSPSSYDIIFLDPPYASGLYTPALRLIYENSLLNAGGTVVLEWDFTLSAPEIPPEFTIIKERRYGRVALTFVGAGDTTGDTNG